MPMLAVAFLVSLMVPLGIHIGPVFLHPHRLLVLVLFLPLLAALLGGRAGRVSAIDLLMIFSTVWAGLAYLASTSFGSAVEPIGIHFVEFLGAYLLGRISIRSSSDLVRVARSFFWLVVLLLPFAALESLSGRALLLEAIPSKAHSIVDAGERLGLRRAQTVFSHPIHYGVFSAAGLGFA